MLWLVAVAFVLGALGIYRLRASSTPSRPIVQRIPKTGKTYLVTGGHGVLGSHIVEALVARGESGIKVLDMAPSTLFEEEQKDGRVVFFKASILDSSQLEEALKGVDTVFHTAALVNFWERFPHLYSKTHAINVTGTEKVLEASRKCGVKQFIHMSSASIFITKDIYEHPIHGADESLPIPSQKESLCHYTATKSIAEKVVLESNGKDGLLTAAVRIAALFGPRDTLVAGQFLTRETKAGLPFKQDFVYVENVAHSMFCIEKHLTPSSPVAGQAYFITNGEPITVHNFKERMATFFPGDQVKPFPFYMLRILAHVSEFITWISNGKIPLGQLAVLTPPVLYLSCEYTFSDAKAKKEIGYAPVYSLDEGIEISAKYLKEVIKAQEQEEKERGG